MLYGDAFVVLSTGSLELACMRAGYAEYHEIRDSLDLPLLRTGAVVVAWNDEEYARLAAIAEQAHANGVADVALIDASMLYRMEPNLAPGALGAVQVPGERVIDAWSAPLAYASRRHPAADHRMKHDVIIIGSGPAGLAAATELRRLGILDIVVLERELWGQTRSMLPERRLLIPTVAGDFATLDRVVVDLALPAAH